jgi:hypothetical protein
LGRFSGKAHRLDAAIPAMRARAPPRLPIDAEIPFQATVLEGISPIARAFSEPGTVLA